MVPKQGNWRRDEKSDPRPWVAEPGEMLSVTPAWARKQNSIPGKSFQDLEEWSPPGLREYWVGFTAGGQTLGLKPLFSWPHAHGNNFLKALAFPCTMFSSPWCLQMSDSTENTVEAKKKKKKKPEELTANSPGPQSACPCPTLQAHLVLSCRACPNVIVGEGRRGREAGGPSRLERRSLIVLCEDLEQHGKDSM